MNDNKADLRRANLELHGPVIEALDRLNARRINTMVLVPKTASDKERAAEVELVVKGYPSNEKNAAADAEKVIAETVERYNAKRPQQIIAEGMKMRIGEVVKPRKKADHAEASPDKKAKKSK